ncbi:MULTISPECIES: methionine ABC transporter permease [Kitasatospora]|uniref:D-methionine transport system permease protein n=1 Tax=Kitasatospora cineracea TaxID=88074 RepID=A0A3N4RQU5_9ACTN|nr:MULTISPECIES: methionine ABC transporter permease [Kitasatospora]ROR45449.1 D-methionine transport system permease protein [Kitasatospora cineracea]RPE35802.1 D-methionine transport system permease protein [Kitasatospora cineracea]WAL70836.1 ABC transporter permease [Kitasatospora sp. YST-16]WNW36871.1 methionine ABC transporter permease [Streptomyces sp. Li-HN-5-13]
MTWDQMQELLWPATRETLGMVGIAGLATLVIGLPIGLLLVLTDKGGLLQNLAVSRVLGAVVNIGRSIPFVILIVAVIPFTKLLMGTSLGWQAASVPLAIGAIPFFARLVETSVREVDGGLVEALKSMGASTGTIVRKTLLPEALPSLVASATTTVIALIGYSAMAGTVGGGGLGDLAIRYGYQRFETTFMWVIVAELVIIVTAIQLLGDLAARRLSHRGDYRSPLSFFRSATAKPEDTEEDLLSSH